MTHVAPPPPYATPSFDGPALRLALVLGDSRLGHLRDRVAGWTQRELARRQVAFDVIVSQRQVPVYPASPRPNAVQSTLSERLQCADMFLLLLSAEEGLDQEPAWSRMVQATEAAWQAKPIGFIVYGGKLTDSTWVDQLRLSFAECQAMPLGRPISCAHAHERFGTRGELYASLGESQRLTYLLARLTWWAHALRQARLALPYNLVGNAPAVISP